MKTKLALIVLVLVILPTAVLSLLASHVLRNWEMVLQRRLEIAAANAVQEASSQLRARLEDNLERVRSAMADSLGRRGELAELAATDVRLQKASPLVDQVYLFMNPTGLVYPEPGSKAEGGRMKSEMGKTEGREQRAKGEDAGDRSEGRESGGTADQRLAERLRKEIASAPAVTDMISFVMDDALYCFSHVRNRKGLYAGYRVSSEGFERVVTHIASLLSAGGFVLSASMPGAKESGDIVISDSFSPEPGAAAGDSRAGLRPPARVTARTAGDALARGRLHRPFDFVELTAYLDDADAPGAGEGVRRRLYGWGILLAAGVIVMGAALIFREAAVEIRRAKERSDFVMGVSHDLRTPVSSMKMLAESLYLEHVPDRAKQKDFLGAIVRECDRLADMVERLLFFVRQEHDAVVYAMAPVDAGLLVKSSVETFAERTGMRVWPAECEAGKGQRAESGGAGGGNGIELRVENNLPMVKGDWEALAKVVLNLLDNAVKYGGKELPIGGEGAGNRSQKSEVGGLSSESHRAKEDRKPEKESEPKVAKGTKFSGTIEVAVFAAAMRGRSWVKVAVRDHGIGIERKELKKIFRKFYRVSSGPQRGIRGVGLGLALCRDIVKAHKGRIEVESRPGKGSVFTVCLPGSGAGG